MPELPEVETVRRDLEREVVGKSISDVTISGRRVVRRHDPSKVVAALTGNTVRTLRRQGKFLFADLATDETLVLHLRMSGQLLWTPDPTSEAKKHTHAVLAFASGEELRFVDPRTFGEMWITSPDVPELAHVGPDALYGVTDVDVLRSRLARRASPLKSLLVNQQVVSGIGNIYADEILFRAGLHPHRSPASLDEAQLQGLLEAMGAVLREAVELRGSSLRDAQYVDAYGRAGKAQHAHCVYARLGEPCRRCGTPVERVKFGARSAFHCPHCQR